MKPFEYIQPKDLPDLFANLPTPGYTLLAGGTDILPKIHKGVLTPAWVVDISTIEELNFIRENEQGYSIGALTVFSQLERHTGIKQYFPALFEAVNSIGSPMTRSRGTIGGNIANASPAGDTLSALMAHDARVELRNSSGIRQLTLEKFLTSPGKTALHPGEIITCIHLPKPPGCWGSSFQKHGPRSGMTISIVNAAVHLTLNTQGEVHTLRIALGAVAPTVVRCLKAEEFLTGKKPKPDLWQQTAEIAQSEIKPIEDVRGSVDYRLALAKGLLIRALETASNDVLRRLPV